MVCWDNAEDRAVPHDCSAHSALCTPDSNLIWPLFIFTDTGCSSGQFDANGQLVQTGGDVDGPMKIQMFTPCGDGTCNLVEQDTQLQNGRWYASNQILPDGMQIIVGGHSSQTIEYVPANCRGTIVLNILAKEHLRENGQEDHGEEHGRLVARDRRPERQTAVLHFPQCHVYGGRRRAGLAQRHGLPHLVENLKVILEVEVNWMKIHIGYFWNPGY